MEDVGPQAVDGQVAPGGPAGELVGAQEGGVDHARGLADQRAHQLVVADAARALGEEREHDVPAVVVGEALARRGTRSGSRRAPRRYCSAVASSCTGTGITYAVDVVERVLVEVVADPRPVGEQVLDGHVVGDQRQVVAQQRPAVVASSSVPRSTSAITTSAVRPLVAARGRELRVDGVRDLVGAVGEPVGGADSVSPRAVDADHAGEPGASRHLVDRLLERLHPAEPTNGRGVEPGGEIVLRPGASVTSTGWPASRAPRHQGREAAEAGRRLERRRRRGSGPRAAAGRGAGACLASACRAVLSTASSRRSTDALVRDRLVLEGVAGRDGLQDHDGQAVTDDVVQLAGDPGALVAGGGRDVEIAGRTRRARRAPGPHPPAGPARSPSSAAPHTTVQNVSVSAISTTCTTGWVPRTRRPAHGSVTGPISATVTSPGRTSATTTCTTRTSAARC